MRKTNETLELSDPGAEKAVLAGIFQYGITAFVDIADIITVDSFTVNENKFVFKIFEIVLKDGDKIDETSIIATAKRLGYDKEIFKNKDDAELLRAILTFPIYLENVTGYARRLAKLEFARNARLKIKKAYDDLSSVTGKESVEEILSIPENAIFSIIEDIHGTKSNAPVQITEGGEQLLQDLIDGKEVNIGLPTPFNNYNNAIGGGLRRGGVNLICARPKVGKSLICKSVAYFLAKKYIPVLVLDTEMCQNDQLFRLISTISRVELLKIEDGRFGMDEGSKNAVLDAYNSLTDKPLHYVSVAGKPFEEILSIIRRWILKDVGKDENGVTKDCAVIYDYFKLMDTNVLKEMQEYQALGFQISRLSDFAKHYDFACLAFTQLNREEDISQSDRLRWLAHSYARLRNKTRDEIATEGVKNGNRRLHVEDTRFGPGLGDDTIDFRIDGSISLAEEIGLSSEREARAKQEEIKKVTGFEHDIDEVPFNTQEDRG